jgi:hypothetical protein
MEAAVVLIESVRAQAAQSVDFSPRDGALCPVCGCRMPVATTRPWEDNFRIRYHRCSNVDECVAARLGLQIKSIQSL